MFFYWRQVNSLYNIHKWGWLQFLNFWTNGDTMLQVEGVKIENVLDYKSYFREHLFEKWSDIKDHLPRLFANSKGRILEVGVRAGISTSAILTGLSLFGGHLWSIDIEACNIFASKNWTFIRADSLTFEFNPLDPPFSLDTNQLFDLVFIDGNHDYKHCYSDLVKFGAQGKKIMVHDYLQFPDVNRAVHEFKRRFNYSLSEHAGSFGLAELTRR